ncbi:MAG: hypothetical protein QXO53_01380 [Fervidicoccaceae archaeon]
MVSKKIAFVGLSRNVQSYSPPSIREKSNSAVSEIEAISSA